MNAKVNQVMQKAMQANNQNIATLEPIVDAKMGTIVDSCFARNTSNADRFAECIAQKNKKVEQIMKSMELKLFFFTKKANECLNANRSVADCATEAESGLKASIDGIKSSIERL